MIIVRKSMRLRLDRLFSKNRKTAFWTQSIKKMTEYLYHSTHYF